MRVFLQHIIVICWYLMNIEGISNDIILPTQTLSAHHQRNKHLFFIPENHFMKL